MAASNNEWLKPIPPKGREAALAIPTGDESPEELQRLHELRSWYPERARPITEASADAPGAVEESELADRPIEWLAPYRPETPEPTEEEGRGALSKMGATIGNRLSDLGSGIIRTGGAAVGGMIDTAADMYNVFTDNKADTRPRGQAAAERIRAGERQAAIPDTRIGAGIRDYTQDLASTIETDSANYYNPEPVNSWGDVKNDWSEASNISSLTRALSTTVKFGLETGVVSTPDMLMMMASMPAYVTALIGNMAQDRAEADGRDKPTADDFAASTGFAIGVAALDRLGLGKIMKGWEKSISGAALKGAIWESPTEFIQSGLEYLNEVMGTKKEGDWLEALDHMFAGAVGGGVAGAGMGATGRTAKVLSGYRTEEEQREDARLAKEAADREVQETAEPVVDDVDVTTGGWMDAARQAALREPFKDKIPGKKNKPQVPFDDLAASPWGGQTPERPSFEQLANSPWGGQSKESGIPTGTLAGEGAIAGGEAAGTPSSPRQEAINTGQPETGNWEEDIRRQLQAPTPGEQSQWGPPAPPRDKQIPLPLDEGLYESTAEPVEDLKAQLDYMVQSSSNASGSGAKDAVFIPEANRGDLNELSDHLAVAFKRSTPAKYEEAERPIIVDDAPGAQGVLITTNKDKADKWRANPDDATTAEVLGYLQPKGLFGDPDNAKVVQKLDADGNVVWEQLATDGNEQKAIDAMGGKTTKLPDTTTWQKNKYVELEDYTYRVISPLEAQKRREMRRKGLDFDAPQEQKFETRAGREGVSTLAPITVGKTAPAPPPPDPSQLGMDLRVSKRGPVPPIQGKPAEPQKREGSEFILREDKRVKEFPGNLPLKPGQKGIDLKATQKAKAAAKDLEAIRDALTGGPASEFEVLVELSEDAKRYIVETIDDVLSTDYILRDEKDVFTAVDRINRRLEKEYVPVYEAALKKLRKHRAPKAAVDTRRRNVLADRLENLKKALEKKGVSEGRVKEIRAKIKDLEKQIREYNRRKASRKAELPAIASARTASNLARAKYVSRESEPPVRKTKTPDLIRTPDEPDIITKAKTTVRQTLAERGAIEKALKENLKEQDVINAELADPRIAKQDLGTEVVRPRLTPDMAVKAKERDIDFREGLVTNIDRVVDDPEYREEIRKIAAKRARDRDILFDSDQWIKGIIAAREEYRKDKAAQADEHYALTADEVFEREASLKKLKAEEARLRKGILIKPPEAGVKTRHGSEKGRYRQYAQFYEEPEIPPGTSKEKADKLITAAWKRAQAAAEQRNLAVALIRIHYDTGVRPAMDLVDDYIGGKNSALAQDRDAAHIVDRVLAGRTTWSDYVAKTLGDDIELQETPANRLARNKKGELVDQDFEPIPLIGVPKKAAESQKPQLAEQGKGLKEQKEFTREHLRPIGSSAQRAELATPPELEPGFQSVGTARQGIDLLIAERERVENEIEKAHLPKVRRELKDRLEKLNNIINDLEAKLAAEEEAKRESEQEQEPAEPAEEETSAPEEAAEETDQTKPTDARRDRDARSNRRGSKPWGATSPRIVSEPSWAPSPRISTNDFTGGTGSPYEYQVEGANYALDALIVPPGDNSYPSFFLADAPGVGKTLQMLMVANYYAARGGRVLFVHNGNWRSSFQANADLLGMDLKQFEEMSWTGFSRAGKFRDALPDSDKYDLVILDEAQGAKSGTSAQGKAVTGLRKYGNAKATMLASATPTDSWKGLNGYAFLEGKTLSDYLREFGVRIKGEGNRASVVFMSGWTEHASVVALTKSMAEIDARGKRLRREFDIDMEVNDVVVEAREWHQQEIDGAAINLQRLDDRIIGELAMYSGPDRAMATSSALSDSKILTDTALSDPAYNLAVESIKKGELPIIMSERHKDAKIGSYTLPSSLSLVKAKLLANDPKLRIAELYGGEMTIPQTAKMIADIAADKYDVVLTTSDKGGVGIDLDTKTVNNKKRHLIAVGQSYSSLVSDQALGRVARVTTAIPAKATILSANTFAGIRAKALNKAKDNFSRRLKDTVAFDSSDPYGQFVIETARFNGDVGVTFATFNRESGAIDVVKDFLNALPGQEGWNRRQVGEWIIPKGDMPALRDKLKAYLQEHISEIRALASDPTARTEHSPASQAAVDVLSSNPSARSADLLRAVQGKLDPSDRRHRVINKLLSLGATTPASQMGDVDPSGFSYDIAGLTLDGYYDPATDKISINTKSNDVAHAVVHEATHAALDARLDSDNVFRETIETIRDEVSQDIGQFSIAVTDSHEFLSEALSNVALQEVLSRKTLWSRFVDAVRRTFRMVPGRDTSALSRILAAVDTDTTGVVNTRAAMKRAAASTAEVTAEGKGFVREARGWGRRGSLQSMTREQITDSNRRLLTRLSGVLPDDPSATDNSLEAKNPLLRLNNAVNSRDYEVTRQHSRGYKFHRPIAELEKHNPKEYTKLADVAIDSTRYEVWPGSKFDDPGGRNHHLKYTGAMDERGNYLQHSTEVVAARKKAYSRIQANYLAMDKKTRKIYDDLVEGTEEQWNETVLGLATQITDLFPIAEQKLDSDNNPVGTPTPISPTKKAGLAERLMNDDKGEVFNQYVVTETDTDGVVSVDEKTTKALRSQLSDMRHRAKVRGPYVPLKRDGNYVVEAKGEEKTLAVKFSAVDSVDIHEKAKRRAKKSSIPYAEAHKQLLAKAASKLYYEKRKNIQETNRDIKFDALQDNGDSVSGTYYEYALEFHRSEILAEEARQGFVADGMTAPDVRLKHAPSNMRGISGDLKTRIEARLGPGNDKLINALNMAMLEMMPETSIHKASLKRQGIKGASKDLVWSTASYINAHGYYMGQLKYGAKANAALRDLRVIADSPMVGEEQHTKFRVAEIASFMKAREDADLTRDPDSLVSRAAQASTSLMFIQHLWSTSYSMINATQTYMLTLPWLQAQQHRVRGAKGSAAQTLGSAYSALAPVIVRRMGSVGFGFGFIRGKAVDPAAFDFLAPGEETVGEEIKKNIRSSNLVHKDGVIKMLDELGRNGKITMTFAADMKGEANKTRYEGAAARQAQAFGSAFMDWTRIMPHLTETLNRSVSSTAAYELAVTNMGYTHKQAVEFATEAVDKTHFGYAPSNKPWLMSRAGPLGEMSKVVTQFMQHPQHIYYLMTRNTYLSYDSIRKLASGKELTVAEREQARADLRTSSRTIAYVAATHMLAAGVIGGTFEPVMIAAELAYGVFTAAGDEDDPTFEVFMRNALHDGLTEMGFGEDDTKLFVTLFAKGAPAAFLGTDVSSRIGRRNLFTSGMDNNAEGGDWVKSAIISILGPGMSTLVKYGEAYKYARKGDSLRAVENMSPKMIRDLVRTYRFNTEGVTDTYNIPMRGDLAVMESVVNSLGFQPTAMTDMYDKRGAIKSAEFRIDKRRKRYIEDFKRADSPEERAQIWAEIRQFNKVVPKWARISYGKTLLASIRESRKRGAMSQVESLYLPRKRRELLESEGRSF